MKKNIFFKGLAPALFAGLTLVSCSEDTPTPNPNGGDDTKTEGKYVIAAQVTGTGTTTNLLLTVDDLESGEITTDNNGYLNDGASAWIFHKNDLLWGLTYNQGNAGQTRSFFLNEKGEVNARAKEFEVNRYTTFGTYNDLIFTSSSNANKKVAPDANGYYPYYLTMNFIDIYGETITPNDLTNPAYSGENYFGNGEYVMLAGFEQVGNKIFTSAVPMGLSQYGAKAENGKYVRKGYEDLVKTEDGGSHSSSYKKGELQWTQYPDECYIAVYDNASFTGKRLIKTNKMSYACGRMKSSYQQTIRANENGDLYVFSPSYAKTMQDKRQQTTLPAAVMRIKNGTEKFDDTYYVNLEAQSNGKGFLKVFYVGGNNFLLMMYDKPFAPGGKGLTANELAIFNADTQKLTYVTGLPSKDKLTSIEFGANAFVENGKAYVLITANDSDAAVYSIDIKTAVAKKGLVVKGASKLNAIGKLKPRK